MTDFLTKNPAFRGTTGNTKVACYRRFLAELTVNICIREYIGEHLPCQLVLYFPLIYSACQPIVWVRTKICHFWSEGSIPSIGFKYKGF
jgi:hypothetical protein